MNESHLHALYRTRQVAEIDRVVMTEGGIEPQDLMQRAGRAAFDLVCARHPGARRWLVVCGPGNNGGDGYVVATLAAAAGFSVRVVQLPGAPQKPEPGVFNPSAWQAWDTASRLVWAMEEWLGGALGEADVIVDGLLGSGLRRPLEGRFSELVEAMNTHPAPIVALDTPSGLDTDTGMPRPLAVRAESTLCFIALKRGLLTGLAGDHTGSVYLATLGVPESGFQGHSPDAHVIDPEPLWQQLGQRAPCAHKGQFGHVLLLGGNRGMGGAAAMCAAACLRSGAGLVTVLTHPDHASALIATRPEVMWVGWREETDLDPLLARASVVVLGPGLGRDGWASTVCRKLFHCGLPLVLDADGLSLLHEQDSRAAPMVITPHPGEAARLLNTDSADIMQDRFAAARQLVEKFHCVCVLKGAGTLICEQEEMWLCDHGNPGMASAGMGDTLTGVIAGLLAQGLSAPEAARYGVFLHAAAGDLAAVDGARGLLASDLLAPLRGLLNGVTPLPGKLVRAWP